MAGLPVRAFKTFSLMGRFTLPLALALALVGCPKDIKQDANTGKDGKPGKGAKQIKIDDEGEGTAKDIVTYPGGDRIDWKFFEIKKKGNVEVELKWDPPRPGLDLSMNIYDDLYHVLKKVKPAPPGEGRRSHKNATLENLEPGKYYVQVYASARGDAGAYTLDIHWSEVKEQVRNIPDPPKLPAPPGTPPPGTPGSSGPAVIGGCPPNTPPGKCPPCTPGTQAGAACVCPDGTSAPPCPQPLCMAGAKAGQQCTCTLGQEVPPPCPVAQQPKFANITQVTISGQDLIVIIDKGSDAGIAKGWTGQVLIGTTQKPLRGFDFPITSVTQDEATGKIKKKGRDELGENFRVLLTPPPEKAP